MVILVVCKLTESTKSGAFAYNTLFWYRYKYVFCTNGKMKMETWLVDYIVCDSTSTGIAHIGLICHHLFFLISGIRMTQLP